MCGDSWAVLPEAGMGRMGLPDRKEVAWLLGP